MATPTSCDATNWMRIRELPGGLSTRGPISPTMISCRNDRTSETSLPARMERRVATKPLPISESHSGNRIDGRVCPICSTGTSFSFPITVIGSMGMWIAAANSCVLVPK